MTHIAYVKAATAAKIIAGEKTCESRFGLRLPLAAKAQPGDRIYFKAGLVRARARITQRLIYRLGDEPLEVLFERHKREVHGSTPHWSWWASNAHKSYLVLLRFEGVEELAFRLPDGIISNPMQAFFSFADDPLEAICGVPHFDKPLHRIGTKPREVQPSLFGAVAPLE